MPPKKKRNDNTQVYCWFCEPDERKHYSNKAFSSHMETHDIDTYLLHPIIAFQVPCRIMVPYTDTCPFQDCDSRFTNPNNLNFGFHFRDQHTSATVEFQEAMSRGKYFWWSIGPVGDGECILSPAFDDTELYDKAVALLTLPDTALDTLDQGLLDHLQVDAQFNELDVEDPEAALETVLRALSLEPPVRPSSPEVQRQVPEIPNLNLPIGLSQYQFGLLHLVDFPSQPTILVCLACRKAVSTDQAKQCIEHIRNTHDNRVPVSVPLVAFPSAPLPDAVDDEESDEEEGGMEQDKVDMDEEGLDLDEEERVPRRSNPGRYKALHNFFKSSTIKISKPSPLPDQIIPAIPFFPLANGYKCPVDDCIYASLHAEPIQGHLNNKHMDLGDNEAYPAPLQCKVQTLDIRTGNTPYFAVHPPPENSPSISVEQRVLEQLLPQEDPSSLRDKAPYTNAFMMRWRYRSIYPNEFAAYTPHVDKLLPRSTIIHSDHQSAKEQLLALGCFAYAVRVGKTLAATSDGHRRLFGYKKRAITLEKEPVTTSFREHGSYRMTINYTLLYTTFLGYVLRCILDPDLDPDLLLHDEIRAAATELHQQLDQRCSNHLKAALKKITVYPLEEAYIPMHPFIKDTKYTEVVMDAAHSLFDAIHALGWSLVLHPRNLRASVPELTVPVTRFFAWRAWSPYTRTFRNPNALHSLFCQMQWFMRLVVFERFIQEAKDVGDHEVWPLLMRLHDDHLIQDAPTPFGILQDQTRYSSVVASSIAAVPTTTWDAENNAVAVHGQSVSLSTFQNMVHGVIKRAKEILDEHIFFGRRQEICGQEDGYFERDVAIQDLAYSNVNGYSYLKANRCFSDCRNKLATYVSKTPKLLYRFHREFLLPGGGFAWNHAEIQSWLDAVDQFLLYLTLCVYWGSGQPCRLPELVSLVSENIPERPRNLYSVQGSLMIVQLYTKSLRTTQKPRPNIRMPAHQIQELIEAFLCYVHPLMGQMYAIMGTRHFAQSHLFTQKGRAMKETAVSHFMRQVSNEFTGYPWGVRIWRQYMISLSNMMMPTEVLRMPMATTVITSQASHSQQTAEISYDQREDLSVSYISTQHFQQYRMASLAWLELIGLPHPRMSCIIELRLLTKDTPSAAPPAVTTRELEDITLNVIKRVSQIERANTHSMVQHGIINAFASLHTSKIIPTRTIPLQIPVQPPTVAAVRRLLGDGASFRSLQQAQCIQHVLDRVSLPLLVVLPMGHGKSLIYQLPVCLERENHLMTVVIVPLLSLAQAACVSAEKLGINAHFINPSDPKPEDELKTLTAELVVFTYDLLITSKPVQMWIRTKVNSGLIPRIVVDEAHTIITENEFRTSFNDLPHILKQLSVPLVLMTGTLPPAVEDQLVSAFTHCGSVPSVRLPTDRPNLSYHVAPIQANEGTMEEIVERFRQEVIPRLRENLKQRAILYAQTVKQADRLADLLNASLYMNPMELPIKQGHLAGWLDPDNTDIDKHVMVATSSLSLGIDYDDCPDVWFFGDPYGGVINFAQMAARGGSNNRVATIVLFPAETRGKDHYRDLSDWNTFKSTTGCRRLALSRHLDGSYVTCAGLPGAAFCDNCAREVSSSVPPRTAHPPFYLVPPITQAADSVFLSHMIHVSRALYSFVETVLTSCIYCRMGLSPNTCTDHTAENCPSNLAQKRSALKATLKAVRKEIHVENVVACLRCHLPQHKNIIGAMESHLPYHGDSEHDCKLEWTTIDILLAILSAARLTKPLLARVGNVQELFHWLLTPISESPGDPLSKGYQLLRLHYLIPAIAYKSPFSPLIVQDLAKETWFADWLVQPESRPSSPPLLALVPLRTPTKFDDPKLETPNNHSKENPTGDTKREPRGMTQEEWWERYARMTEEQLRPLDTAMEEDPPIQVSEVQPVRRHRTQEEWDAEQQRLLEEAMRSQS